MNDTHKMLSPGQTLLLAIEPHDRGTFQQYTYDEIVAALASKRSRSSKSRMSKTPATKASRTIGLLGRAIVTGKWSTGAVIDKSQAFDRLINVVKEVENISNLTDNAKSVISTLISCRTDVANLSARQAELHAAFVRGFE